jgi:signal transduction histidine kinase
MLALKRDLRLRIAAAIAAVCIALIGTIGLVLYLATVELENQLVAQIVAEEMEFLMQRSRSGAAPAVAGGPNLQYYVLRTAEDERHLPPKLQSLAPGNHEVGHGSDELHVAVREEAGVRYVVVYDTGQHEARMEGFARLLVLALAAVVLIALFVGYWLARVLTRQLTELAGRVAVLAPDEPHPPLERRDHDREVAALAHALDQYHARIVEMIRHEQEFSANASHELRTPLTAIQTSCELLAGDHGLSESGKLRVGMIARAAEQMTERIEALLLLARQHLPVAAETVHLRACVALAAEHCRDELARKKLALEIAIPESETVVLDRKALQLVLANLIRNAVRYTDHGSIRIGYEAPRLTVADSGPGIESHHLPQLFERHYRAERGREGLGLGLAIVRRICESLGWRMEVESTPGAGSTFTLVLGPGSGASP